MRISDWSSDVCSSDLRTAAGGAVIAAPPRSNALSEQSGAPRRSVASPPIDADEEEQPDHVDEVPVPGRRLEAEVVIRLEVAGAGPEEADDEEDGADDHMEAVAAGRHVEGRRDRERTRLNSSH